MITFLAIAGAVMAAASLILHAIAPLTATTVDDKIEAAVDEVKTLISAASSVASPAAKPAA